MYIDKINNQKLFCPFCRNQINKFDYDRFFRCACGAHYIYVFNFDYDDLPDILRDYVLLCSNDIYSGIVDIEIDYKIKFLDWESEIAAIFLRLVTEKTVQCSNQAFASLGRCFSKN